MSSATLLVVIAAFLIFLGVATAPFAQELLAAWWTRVKAIVPSLSTPWAFLRANALYLCIFLGGIIVGHYLTTGIDILPIPIINPPSPIPSDSLLVLMVEDAEDQRSTYSPVQLDVLLSRSDGSVRQLIEAKGGQVRVIDDEQLTQLERDQPWVMAAAKQVTTTKLPFIVASHGKKWFAEPIDESTPAKIKSLAESK